MTITDTLFSRTTRAIIYGSQYTAIQRMLDFDYTCERSPSVAAIITEGQDSLHKAFWGGTEIIIPVYSCFQKALKKHKDVDVVINFSSFRSAYTSSQLALTHPKLIH